MLEWSICIRTNNTWSQLVIGDKFFSLKVPIWKKNFLLEVSEKNPEPLVFKNVHCINLQCVLMIHTSILSGFDHVVHRIITLSTQTSIVRLCYRELNDPIRIPYTSLMMLQCDIYFFKSWTQFLKSHFNLFLLYITCRLLSSFVKRTFIHFINWMSKDTLPTVWTEVQRIPEAHLCLHKVTVQWLRGGNL